MAIIPLKSHYSEMHLPSSIQQQENPFSEDSHLPLHEPALSAVFFPAISRIPKPAITSATITIEIPIIMEMFMILFYLLNK